MGLFGNIFNKPNKEFGARNLMNLIVDNSLVVLDKSWNNDKGFIYELLICTSIYVFNAYDESYSNTTEFKNKYLNELLNYCAENQLQRRIEGDSIDFLNSRLRFYDREFRDMFSEYAIVPVKIVYNLYELPLTSNPGESKDLKKCFELSYRLVNMVELIEKNIHITQ